MYIVDEALVFFSVFLDLQSIRVDEDTTSKQLIFFNALTDVCITLRKKKTSEVAKSSPKKIIFYESIRVFPKISETTNFDHSNYQLFKRIPAVPGTSNNQGLTV